jgi:hypothetical protein
VRLASLRPYRRRSFGGVYSLRPEPLAQLDKWLGQYRALWEQRMNALHTEIARGKKERRSAT